MSGEAPVTRILVDGDMTIYRAADLKSAFVPLPGGSTAIEIDLSNVAEIDTAGLQLLLIAQRDAAAVGRELRVTATSAAVDAAVHLLGLRHHLGLPSAA